MSTEAEPVVAHGVARPGGLRRMRPTLGSLVSRPWLHAALTGGLAFVLGFVAHRTWRADLSVPLHYAGDGLQYLAFAKSIHDHGWLFENGSLGAPFGLLLYDYIEGGWINYLGVWLIDLVTANYVVAHSVFFLLSYPLAAIAAWWALRRLAVAPALAIALGVLYALAPYHLDRNVNHYYLSLYYGLPPFLSYAVTTAAGRTPMRLRGGRLTRRHRLLRLLPPLAAAVLAGLMSAYYVAFAGVLMVAAGVFGWLHSGRRQVLVGAFAMCVALSAAFAVQYAPSLVYRALQGTNADVARRFAADVETDPLKPADLLLPVPGHPVAPLASLRARYGSFASASQPGLALGAVGSLGLVLVLGGVVAAAAGRGRRGSLVARLRPAGWLTAVAVAVAMLGGLATLASLLLATYLRSWDRIGIAIAFFALAGLGITATALRHRLRRRWRGPALAALAAVLLVGGTLDQAGSGYWVRPYDAIARRWRADAAFVGQIEAQLPARAMVFQLPHIPFPERAVGELRANDQLRLYLHSDEIAWSAGLIAGRDPGWLALATGASMPARLELLRAIGYAGVTVNRLGYEGMPAGDPAHHEILASLAAELGAPTAVSADDEWSFFPLADGQPHPDALDPVWLRAAAGFDPLELDGDHLVRTLVGLGEIELRNDRPAPREVVIAFVLEPLEDVAAEERALAITWPDGVREQVLVAAARSVHRRRISLPAGTSELLIEPLGLASGRGVRVADVLVVDTSFEALLPGWAR